jgi:hypothetical protein
MHDLTLHQVKTLAILMGQTGADTCDIEPDRVRGAVTLLWKNGEDDPCWIGAISPAGTPRKDQS